EQCPESGGDHDRDAGEPRALAVEPGLDHLTGDPLGNKEETDDPEQHRPPRSDGNGESCRKCGGDNGADVGDEPQEHREDAPEYRVRYADEPQPAADQHAQTRVDPGLKEEIAAEAAGGVVQRLGRAPKIPAPLRAE